MKVVDSDNECQILKSKLDTEPSIWYPVWVDNEKHPLNNKLSFIFVKTENESYVLPHNHVDAVSLSIELIHGILNTNGKKWTFQKKKMLHCFKNLNVNINDIDSAYFLESKSVIDYNITFEKLISHYNRNGYYTDIMQSIPILKLCEHIEVEVLKYMVSESDSFDWYNNTYIPILCEIESYGIKVNREFFLKKWPNSIKHIDPTDTVYTEYNPFTVTGRPSNRHGGINYSALSKRDGSRNAFISNGIFLQMDYDAYHPRIIGKIIKHELPKNNVHGWLAEQYGCETTEAKSITFRLLYGGIDREFYQIPYFKKTDEWIKRMWVDINKDGYIQTRYRKIPLSWIDNINSQKAFNYLIQAIETEINIDKIRLILNYIKNTSIKLVLYTYDSFLFDCPNTSNIDDIKELKNIIEMGGFPIKASWSNDYGNL
jgi:hypothetical protein